MAAARSAARMTADVVVGQGGFDRLAEIVRLSRRARGIERQNLILAVFYNATLLSSLALGHVRPGLAAVGMVASSRRLLPMHCECGRDGG